MSFLLVCLVSYTRTVLPTSCVGAVRPASEVVLQQLVCPCGTGSSHQPHCGLMKEHLNNTNSCHYQVFIIISTWLNTHLSSPQILSAGTNVRARVTNQFLCFTTTIPQHSVFMFVFGHELFETALYA